MIIYKVTNLINNKVYIGQTIRTLSKRWTQHICKGSSCKFLSSSIQKYKKENFTIEQIDSAESIEELNEKEIYWIKYYNSTNSKFGYNLNSGGENSIPNIETRQKMSKSHLGRKKSEEHRKNIKKAVTGRKYDDNARQNMSKAHIGHKHTEETRLKMSLAKKGRKMSLESILKLKESKNKNKKLGFRTASTPIICIDKNGTETKFDAVIDAAKFLGVSRQSITNVLRGRSRTSKGYTFRYQDRSH